MMNHIKKAVYAGLLMTLPILASAEEYYVSQAGNDAWSGTLSEPNDQKTDGPFRSLTHINKKELSEGDRISLRRGDVWQTPLVINTTGITIDAYGSGNLPLLNMAERISNWEPHQGNIYVADWPHDVVQLFADDKRVQIAHHPNKGFMYADADALTLSSLVDNDLPQIGQNLVGAQVMMRARHWVWYGSKVTGLNGNTLQFDATLPDKYLIEQNYGYILAEKLWMLDSPGEWYHDKNEGKLYVWLKNGDNPNHHQIEASLHDNGILCDGVNNVKIENIAVTKARETGILYKNSNSATLKGCVITDSGEYGIHAGYGTDSHHIVDNTIDSNILGGIAYFWGNITNNTIEKNNITNTFSNRLLRMVEKYHFGWGAGMQVSGGLNNVIRNNRVTNSGYSSVILSGDDNRVERNILENSCLLLDDGGGIYIADTGNVISENIIRHAVGNSEGTPSFVKKNKKTQAQGIYPDDRSENIQIMNNTVINATYGIFLHNSRQNKVQNNTVYSARQHGMLISEDAIVGIPGLVRENRVEDNIFHSISPNQTSLWLSGRLGQADFGTYDRNYYAHPYSSFAIRKTLESDYKDFTLQQWQDLHGFDASSIDLADIHTVKPYFIDSVIGDTLILNGSLDSDKSSWSDGWSSDNTVQTTWTSEGGLDGGCITSSSSRKDLSNKDILTSSGHFKVQKGVDYRIKFSLRANKIGSVSAIVRRSGTPDHDPVGFSKSLPVEPQRRDYEFVFKATENHDESRIDFVSGFTAEVTYYIDNVSIEPVKARYTKPMEDIILLVNEKETPRTIQLQGRTYLDIYGNEVSGSLEIAPFRSIMLVNQNKYTTPLPEQEKEYEPENPVDSTSSTVLMYLPGILAKPQKKEL